MSLFTIPVYIDFLFYHLDDAVLVWQLFLHFEVHLYITSGLDIISRGGGMLGTKCLLNSKLGTDRCHLLFCSCERDHAFSSVGRRELTNAVCMQ